MREMLTRASELAKAYNCAVCGGSGYIHKARVWVEHKHGCDRWHFLVQRHPALVESMLSAH